MQFMLYRRKGFFLLDKKFEDIVFYENQKGPGTATISGQHYLLKKKI